VSKDTTTAHRDFYRRTLVAATRRRDTPQMAPPRAPDRWDPVPNPPSIVQVTVVPGPVGRLARARYAEIRFPAGPRRVVALAVVVAIAVVGVVDALHGDGRNGTGSARTKWAGATVPAAVTAAYRYPLGCLSITLSAGASAPTGSRVDRTGPCWRYGVYVTAILHRVGGVWRLVLEATSPTCPQVSLPAPVRAQLAVCRR
jgi:hypothetical protein